MSVIVSYGGGTNSVAMLVGLHERGERPDHIVFADTGGEKPHTYEHILTMQEWCARVGFPPITTVREAVTLEGDLLRTRALPSIVFGFKTCSQRFKIRPVERHIKQIGITEYTTFIGFDADEPQRAKDFPNVRYPLIEWGWGRPECVEAITRAGLEQPGKSACFFCPSSKKAEILELGRRYPALLDRALAMEANAANLTSVKGLGRDFAWNDLVQWDKSQIQLFPESRVEIDCVCYDGESP